MWLTVGVVCLAFVYILYLKKQIRHVNRQLTQRQNEYVTVQLFDRDLNELVHNMNDLIQAEQRVLTLSKREATYYKEMVSNISHDFRTPLTAIKGYQQLLANDALTAEQQAKLAIAQKHVARLEQLVATFFEYSYLLSSDQQPKNEKVFVNRLVQEAVAGMFPELEARGVAVHLPTDSPLVVVSDEEMIVRILQNLLRNATHHSEGDVTIAMGQTQSDTWISFTNPITVTEPIDPNQFFDRFYTTDRARRKNTGLGLSIVQLLAEKLGGQASAFIKDGMITFHITIKSELSTTI